MPLPLPLALTAHSPRLQDVTHVWEIYEDDVSQSFRGEAGDADSADPSVLSTFATEAFKIVQQRRAGQEKARERGGDYYNTAMGIRVLVSTPGIQIVCDTIQLFLILGQARIIMDVRQVVRCSVLTW